MPNYKLTIQYDGSEYYGWQSQPNGNTIQDYLTKAIQQITQTNINLIGSGRTDSGVHAWGQVANFRINSFLDIARFKHALNSILPAEISVEEICEVHEDFHSRFDATSRTYYYIISKNKSPFYKNYSYYFPQIRKVKLENLRLLSDKLIGEKDFTSFCKTQTDTENKICNIFDILWKEYKNLLFFRIEANRFLHGMVRTTVGTLLQAAIQEKEVTYIEEILKKLDRNYAGDSVPAKGLFLYKVKY
jgi:tRNA pseudouridine38-40 synthase